MPQQSERDIFYQSLLHGPQDVSLFKDIIFKLRVVADIKEISQYVNKYKEAV